MKLKDILLLIDNVHKATGTSMPMICGGVPREKVMNRLDRISDLDITTGDDTVNILVKGFVAELSKKYSISSKKMDDGHTTVFAGNIKIDFSSNFQTPGIDNILKSKGMVAPTSLEKEVFSRDFTCNSLLMTTDLKKVKDITGTGIADIKNKILKTCLEPEITLAANKNRIIRVIYLAAKLGFNVDESIIDWIKSNRDAIRESGDQYLTTNIDKALVRDAAKTIELLNKTGLWQYIPITKNLYPYYKNSLVTTSQLKRNYDYGEGIFSNLDKYKSVADFREKRRKKRKKIIKKIKEMKLK